MIKKLLPAIMICLTVVLVRQLDLLYFSEGVDSHSLYLQAFFSAVVFTSASAVIWCLFQLYKQAWSVLVYVPIAVCIWFFWYQPENVFGSSKSLVQLMLCVIVMPLLATTACLAICTSGSVFVLASMSLTVPPISL